MQHDTMGNRAGHRLIFSPRWTRPDTLYEGDPFNLVIAASRVKNLQVLLGDGKTLFEASITAMHNTAVPGLLQLTVALPKCLLPGLYDLTLLKQGRQWGFEPHCLWLRQRHRNDFACAHISDLHIQKGGRSKLKDRAPLVEALMEHLGKNVKPDFILNTGDLITRYDADKAPLPPAAVFPQLKMVREIILRWRIPHFMTPGNHDVAWPFIRREWLRLMGGPWHQDYDDYSFTQGLVRFIGLDRSVAYDQEHKTINTRLDGSQREWLQAQLNSLPADHKAVIFCHYDYQRELSFYLHDSSVFKVLYGHSAKPCLPPELVDFDGGLRTPYDYQLLVCSEDHGLTLTGYQMPVP